jgi:hypothetical protein
MFCRVVLQVLILSLLFGCRTATETVEITSTPPGAHVQIDGQDQGQTPLAVELSTKRSHKVTLEHPGYQQAEELIVSATSEDAPYIKLGLKADAGHYNDLNPSPLHVELVSELVPRSTGADSFDELGKRIAELDALRDRGEISPEEHARIMEQILAVYEK